MLGGVSAVPVTMIYRNAAYCSKMLIKILLAQLAGDFRFWKCLTQQCLAPNIAISHLSSIGICKHVLT